MVAYLEVACRHQFSLMKLAFSVTLHKRFLSHLIDMLRKLHRNCPSVVAPNSFRYWLQIERIYGIVSAV